MNPRLDPRKLTALQHQMAIEKAAAEKRQAEHEALLASMPDDLRTLYQIGLGFDFIAGLLKRGMFPNDNHASVREAHEFIHRHVLECDAAIVAHPRFAEFFPAQAAKAEAMAAQRVAVAGHVSLVGPDGAPLQLEPAPAILQLGDVS